MLEKKERRTYIGCSKPNARNATLPSFLTKTSEDVRELVMRMVRNGLVASDEELNSIIAYIVHASVETP